MNNGQSYISFSIPCVLLWQCEVATLEKKTKPGKCTLYSVRGINFGLEGRKKYAVIY